MEQIKAALNYAFKFGNDVQISVKSILIVIAALLVTSILLKFFRKIITRKLPNEDKVKFISIFSFSKWFIYVVIILITFNNIGIEVTAIFAASAALLVGIGLALQTLFQDIISGTFILLDQTVHVGDIIEIEGRVGKVEEIKLRTTRAVTVDNRVLIIPNHLFLTNTLYNWTANGQLTREYIDVGVAYGSDTQLVKSLLIEAANSHPQVLKEPLPKVFFNDFADSSLHFRLAFTVNDALNARFVRSDLRFEIDKLFRENKVTIPFPQRDVHFFKNE